MTPLVELFYNPSVDFIVLLVTLLIDAVLALAVLRSNPTSATNRIFSLLTISTMFWLFITYIVRIPGSFGDSIISHRLGIFFAAAMSLFFLLLAHTMPSDRIQLRKPVFYVVLLITAVMMVLNISPYAFTALVLEDGIKQVVPGPGLLPFSVISTVFSILAVYLLIRRYLHAEGITKKQSGLVLFGILAMLLLTISTILLPILIFNSAPLLYFAPLYTLIFLAATAYAITKYQLFNIKVLLTQALTLVIWIVLFARIFGEESRDAQIVDIFVLIFMIIFGVFLVRSVKREVQQRELIEKQEKELEVVNKQQENLLHFISHEIKGYLTKSQAAFAAIVEGDYGAVAEPLKGMASAALEDVRKGVKTVMQILDASNLKKGTMNYVKKSFDLKTLVLDTVKHLKPAADEKNLNIETSIGEGPFGMEGDDEKIKEHLIKNLIDNAIKYTPAGSIKIELNRQGNTLRFSVADSGVGITPEDMKNLFTEGGRGKDSIKINVHSTGYGLFIAKTIAEVHGGKIRAESEGKGRGARFIVELPVA